MKALTAKERGRKYRAAHPDRARDAQLRYKQRHPDRVKAIAKRSKEKNKAKTADYYRSFYALNRDRLRARARDWYSNNKERVAVRIRLKKYGISREEFQELFVAQNGACAGCDKPFVETPTVDHDHETGDVRGLLCAGCNFAIGHVADSPIVLRALAKYLETCSGQRQS